MILLPALLLAIAAPRCDVPQAEQARQMALAYDAFDGESQAYGWRMLNGSGCTDAAVWLLTGYLSANASRLPQDQRLELPFHIGQTYAFSGRNAEAAAWFERSDSPDAPEEWRAFVAAHVAFFRHDREAVQKARIRYAAIAKPGAMRLKFIDGFLACMDKNYMEAVHCAM